MGISFLSLICQCMICLTKEKYAKNNKCKKNQNVLYMIVSVSSRRCENYRMYIKGNSSHQAVMIMCELNWFSHISNLHNIYTLMQSCDVFHTQHTVFFATFDTCVGTMWFDHHKVLLVLMYAH